MKINSISLISVVSAMTFASVANAGVLADFYIGGMAGIGGETMFAEHKNETNASKVFGAVAGMDIPLLRVEAEYDYFDSKDLSTNATMLNLYAKLPTAFVIPYIGAGVGMVFGGEETIAGTEYNIESTVAYQGMLGTTIDILALPLKFDIEGRVLYAKDVYEIPGLGTKPDMLQYGARAKIRFIF